MKLGIITEPDWILNRCAAELMDLPYDVSINPTGREFDVVYHIPQWRSGSVYAPIRVGFFTHGISRAIRTIDRFDSCVCMNRAMADQIIAAGAKRVTVIRPGTDHPIREPVFGVVGRTYGRDPRKGQDVVSRVAGAGFDIRACGPGPWPCPITHPTDERDSFYRIIDYLLIPSLDEGGPMPVVEAISRHIPVIAPNVGWCWEFPVIRYQVGSWDSLRSVLYSLSSPPTWESWRESHRDLFDSLVCQG